MGVVHLSILKLIFLEVLHHDYSFKIQQAVIGTQVNCSVEWPNMFLFPNQWHMNPRVWICTSKRQGKSLGYQWYMKPLSKFPGGRPNVFSLNFHKQSKFKAAKTSVSASWLYFHLNSFETSEYFGEIHLIKIFQFWERVWPRVAVEGERLVRRNDVATRSFVRLGHTGWSAR